MAYNSLSDWLNDVDFQSDLINPLVENGWFEYAFPFMLVYALVITILNNVPMFEERKPVRVIIALVVSLFSIAFPIENGGNTLGDFMMALFPGVTAFSIGILALYIVAAMMGVDLMKFFGDNKQDSWIKYILGGLGLIVIVYYYARGFGWIGWQGSELEQFFEDPLLYIVLVAGLIFYLISKDDESDIRRNKERLENIDKGEAAKRG